MLIYRVLSSLVLLPIVLGVTYLGGAYFAAAVGVSALLAAYEVYRMLRQVGYQPSYVAGLTLVAALILDAYDPKLAIARLALGGTVALLMLWHVLRQEIQGFLTNWAFTLAGALYVGVLAGYMILLRNLPQGLSWLFITFLTTWTCDTAAYFAGTWWGRRGFFARISPKKTVEGAIAGYVAGVAATVIGGHLAGLQIWQSLLLGVILVLAGSLGDLSKSLIKREVGVKDSGNLIPGHGGMLDRVDSLLFAAPVAYYFVVWFVL